MKSKQIKHGLWKNQIVHFNGVQHKVIDFDGKDMFKIDDETIIAILDTGVNSHEEFTGRLLQGYDFIGNDTSPTDGNGHGTACAGIAAAKGNNNMGIAKIRVNVSTVGNVSIRNLDY